MKKIFKKYSLKPEQVNLGWFNKYLHKEVIWKWNKQTISRAFAIGLFCAFIPLPMHTLLAGILAIAFSANILLAMFLVWINNPITMVPIYFFEYKLGSSIIGIEMDPNINFSLNYFIDNLATATFAIWAGGIIVSSLIGIIGYACIISIYKYKALKRLKYWK